MHIRAENPITAETLIELVSVRRPEPLDAGGQPRGLAAGNIYYATPIRAWKQEAPPQLLHRGNVAPISAMRPPSQPFVMLKPAPREVPP
jgi:hypothetical protein